MPIKHDVSIYHKIPEDIRYEEDDDDTSQEEEIAKMKPVLNKFVKKTVAVEKKRPITRQQKKDQTEQPRIFDPEKKCGLCGMYGHDGESGDGCDIMATQMNVQAAMKNMTPTLRNSIKQKWKQHQEATLARKIKSKQGRNILRKELRKMQSMESPEDYLELKRFTIDTYKQTYPEEDWKDPFADEVNGISDYEDLEFDEPLE